MARSRRTLHAAMQDSATPPDTLTATQSVARVVQAEGNNLYTCQLPASASDVCREYATADKNAPAGQKVLVVLVELNARFRNTVYMRRGGYVLVDVAVAQERAAQDAASDNAPKTPRKVVGEIINVVRDEKAWRKEPYWPAEFVKAPAYAAQDSDSDDDNNVGKMPPSDSEDE